MSSNHVCIQIAREKKLESIETTKLKKKILKNLRDLKKDVKDYRKIVKDVSYGDKRLMRVALQGHKVFEIALKDAEPQVNQKHSSALQRSIIHKNY